MPTTVPLNVGNLPNNFCPTSYQAILAGFGAALSATIPAAGGGITISATKPSSTSDIWFQTDSLGRFLGIYLYGQGAWLRAHPMVPGQTIWWFNTLPDFTSYDGGDANSLGVASGPMWQQALDANQNLITAQFILTPGTLPSGKTVAIGNTGGEELHTLTLAETPAHSHFVSNPDTNPAGSGVLTSTNQVIMRMTGTGNSDADYNLLGGASLATIGNSSQVGSGAAHNNMPVYATGYLLQRSSRIFYSIS
jgi:hypothetical protein